MIVGRGFAWGHIGKTGGDATARLFGLVPDLVLECDPPSEPRKHDSFAERGLDDTGRLLVLNIRRLPCWVLSFVNHVKDLDGRFRVPTSGEMSRSRRPDWLIRKYTDGSRLTIHRWLRMEQLRDDLIDFVRTDLRPLTGEELARLQTTPTNPARAYDHDVGRWFTRRDVERLYATNPLWAAVERRVYGGLLLDGPWLDPLRNTFETCRRRARLLVLDTVVRTERRRGLRAARREMGEALLIR